MKIICLFSIMLFLSGCYARVPEKTGLEGKPIPHFTILYTDSTTYFNTEHIPKGKPTVIVCFNPHCIYSRAETKDIMDEISRMRNINFYFVTNAAMSDIRQFGEEYKLMEHSNVSVGLDYTNFFEKYFEVPGYPFIAIFGKEGTLNAVFEGEVSVRQIRNCSEG